MSVMRPHPGDKVRQVNRTRDCENFVPIPFFNGVSKHSCKTKQLSRLTASTFGRQMWRNFPEV